MKYEFTKPFEFEGKSYESLELDLESLRGSDVSAAKKQFAAMGGFSPLPATDMDFCALIAAKLAKQPVEFFQALPAKDYCAVTQAVSNFLLG